MPLELIACDASTALGQTLLQVALVVAMTWAIAVGLVGARRVVRHDQRGRRTLVPCARAGPDCRRGLCDRFVVERQPGERGIGSSSG